MSLLETGHISVVWEWHDGSYDRARIHASAEGWTVSGRHGDTRYLIGVDTDFCCRSLEVSCGADGLTLNRTDAGWFGTETGLIPGSAHCRYLDLGWSALTNTFPIRRLTAAQQATATFPVLMIAQPDLNIRVVEQTYTLQEGGWLYQNNESGYQALLTVDRNGLVTDYPDVCTQKDLGP